jgi:hypothetical protein
MRFVPSVPIFPHFRGTARVCLVSSERRRYNSRGVTEIRWIFSGIGVLVVAFLGRLLVGFWRRRRTAAAGDPSGSSPSEPSEQTTSIFTRPTPDEMRQQIDSLPPFQRDTARGSYAGLDVCWQALFRGIDEDERADKDNLPFATKKWVVHLKHYDPAIPHAISALVCPGVDIERYPRFKFLNENELLTVKGKVRSIELGWVLLYPTEFEFTGRVVK